MPAEVFNYKLHSKKARIMDTESQKGRKKLRVFSFGFAVSQILAVAVVVLVGVWMGTNSVRGTAETVGFHWYTYDENAPQSSSRMAHYHPLFMVLAFLFFQAEAIIAYRMFRHEAKLFTKMLHGFLHLCAICLATFGLIAIVRTKDLIEMANPGAKLPDMATPHAWIGAGVTVAFLLQYVVGLVAFTGIPGVAAALGGAHLMVVHRYLGLTVFIGAAAVSLIGISEWPLLFGLYEQTQYPNGTVTFRECYIDRCGEANLVNIISVVIVLFAISVGWIAAHPSFKRKPLDSD